MKIRPKMLSFQYSILQGAYWASFCSIYAFATVFLLAKGFHSFEIGIIVAIGNVLGVLAQPFFASIADSSKTITLHKLTALLAGVAFFLLILLSIIPNIFIAISLLFIMTNMLLQIIQPLVNSVSVYYVNRNVAVDFGLARGIGSIAYAGMSTLLGYCVELFGCTAIAVAGAILMFLIAFILLCMPTIKEAVHSSEAAKASPENLNLIEFFLHYKAFTVVLLGVTLLFTFHNMTNSYMFQIVQSLGGDSAHMGKALSIAAVIELPTMLFFSKLHTKLSSSKLLIISGFFFAAKATAYVLCSSVPQFYLSQILQIGAFALYIPASVYYVNETMEDADKFKGQAVMTGTNTLGGVIGSLLGGFLIDRISVSAVLISGMLFAIIGALLILCAISLQVNSILRDVSKK